MKKLLLSLLFAGLVMSCQNEEKPTHIVFNGIVENNTASVAKIFGNNFEKELKISENGTFSDTLNIDENGYYSMRIGRESTPIYLVKGKSLSVSLDAKEFDESLVYSGDIAAENNYLAAKYLLSEKEFVFDKVYSLEETDFIKQVNSLNDSYSNLLNSSQGITEEFKAKESKELLYAHINNIEYYEQYYQYLNKDNSFRASETIYDSYKDFNFKDVEAFNNSSAYKRLLEAHYGRKARAESNKSGKDITLSYLEFIDGNFENGTVKDELMYNYLRYGMKANNALEDVYALFSESNQNSENLSKVTSTYNVLKNLTPGKASPTFEYENFKGGNTTLEDLKGKYVYVDVWATWCGPCLREIPSLKKLEEDYHNKNIAFVSLSIDDKKDYEKWRKMITEKELGGIQLIADKDWKSKFVLDYGIKGIPRFILIDTEGNIINSDAPRPSNSDIRKEFDALL